MYSPVLEIVPTVPLPPVMPSTDQLTPPRLALAWNCCCAPVLTVADVGVMVTLILAAFAGAIRKNTQQAAKRDCRNARMDWCGPQDSIGGEGIGGGLDSAGRVPIRSLGLAAIPLIGRQAIGRGAKLHCPGARICT
jgi:hypothetical protein